MTDFQQVEILLVEENARDAALALVQCDDMQGYLISRSLPVEGIEAFLSARP